MNVFSSEDDERLYSVLLDEDEMRMFSEVPEILKTGRFAFMKDGCMVDGKVGPCKSIEEYNKKVGDAYKKFHK